MSHQRDAVPERTEPISEFRQGPRDFEIARDAKGVSDQPVQVERVVVRAVLVVIIVGRWSQAFDDVDEIGEEHAVAVLEVRLQDVLRDIQLAHDEVEPALVALM